MFKIINVNCLSTEYLINVNIVIKLGTGKIFLKKNLDKTILNSIMMVYNIINYYFNNILNKKNLYFNILPQNIFKIGKCIELSLFFGILSLLNNLYIKKNIALLGKIDFYGNIYQVNSLKEKFLIAKKNKINIIILSDKNLIINKILNLEKNFYIIKIKNIEEILNLILKYKNFF